MTRFSAGLLLCFLLFTACRPESPVPKPRGYYRVDFPAHTYQTFDNPQYPYSFQYPAYAKIIRDTVYFDTKPENPYWINMDFPTLGGRLYISYKEINAQQPLEKLLDDSYKLSFFHEKKADYINTPSFATENHVYGMIYNVGGNAASTYQFYATDSVKHFIRGALYFDVTPNADSLKPVNDFLYKDIEHMIQTMKWR
jgi:gliding motility-associated lipoprotein GldD